VHNHGLQPELQPPLPYVDEFRNAIVGALRSGDAEFLANWRERAPHAVRAHPSEEHFLPLLVAYGAAGAGPRVERIDLGVDGGAIAMDAFIFQPN
jgi:4,5-DOPA dioxygenase extradiol